MLLLILGLLTPFSYHLTNLVLHLLNILLVYLISRRIIRQKAIIVLVTFLFAVFPFHSEAVAWVSGLIDVLTCFFYLLSLLSGLIYLKERKKSCLIISLLAFILALLTKENAVTLPLVLFIPGKKVRLVDVKYYLLIIISWLALKLYFSPVVLGPLSYQGFFLSRLFIIYLVLSTACFLFIKIYAKYRKLPQYQSRRYRRDGTGFRLLYQRSPASNAGVSLKYWIVLGIVMVPTAFLPTEERYLYLPSVFLALFIGEFLAIFIKGRTKKIIYLSFIVIILICAFILQERNKRFVISGNIAKNAYAQLKNMNIGTNTDLYFFSLPDNYEGAYLFRTHFDLGLQYNGVLFNKAYILTTTNGIGSIKLIPIEKNTYLIESSKEFVVFAPSVTKILGKNQFEIKNRQATVVLDNDKKTAIINLNPENNNFRLFYFNEDRLVEFP